MKHLSIYEDYDLLRDLTKLGINEVNWTIHFRKILSKDPSLNKNKRRVFEEEHEIANNWTYKNLRIDGVSGDYGYSLLNSNRESYYIFSIELNRKPDKYSQNIFHIHVRINTQLPALNSIIVQERNTNHLKGTYDGIVLIESVEFTKELIKGFLKEPILPYALKVFESIL